MGRKTLTDRTLKALKPAPSRRKDYLVNDAIVPGLGVRVGHTGTKTFVLVTRIPGRRYPTRRKLGKYGALTLEEARQKARDWLQLIARGIDPKVEEEKRKLDDQQRQANSLAAVAAEFIRRHVSKLRTGDEVESAINRELVSRWGGRPISEISRRDVVGMLDEIVERGTPYAAHHLLAYTRKLFNWAIARGTYGLEHSPCDRIKPSEVIGRKEARTRTLTDEELREVWQAAGVLGYPFGPLFKLLLLTGQRLGEAAKMSWSEIDLHKALWSIPARRTKAGAAHAVPLSPDALGLLESLPRWVKGDYVFSTTEGERPVSGFSKAKVRAEKLMLEYKQEKAKERGEDPKKIKLEGWRLHDLRRTMRTGLSGLPIPVLVRELVIGHTKPGLHKVYDQYAYLDEKRHALELWAGRLRSIVEPALASVVPLRA